MLEASSTNQLFQRKCLESFSIDHDLFIFLLKCLFIVTLKCSRASLAPGGRNLCLVLRVGVSGERGGHRNNVQVWTIIQKHTCISVLGREPEQGWRRVCLSCVSGEKFVLIHVGKSKQEVTPGA